MSASVGLLKSIQSSTTGLTLAELLARDPGLARRTIQRWISQWIAQGLVTASGEGRARRYGAPAQPAPTSAVPPSDRFPTHILLSADSQDILAYVDQPLQARKPVGYQRDFLEAYQPNVRAYLPESLRRQLHKMGRTAHAHDAAGTYSRAILNRLLIDLSWASSHLEGNTCSRLDAVALIEQGKAARGKAALETQMILNHKTAIELLVDSAVSADSAGLNRYLLMNLHSALAENLLPNPAERAACASTRWTLAKACTGLCRHRSRSTKHSRSCCSS